jgi:hypothetical protein
MRILEGGSVLIGATTAVGSEIFRCDGNAYFDLDVSALTFTDRTPYPADTKEAWEAIKSMGMKKDKSGVDHSILHDFVKADGGRNMSATLSALVETMKDIDSRLEKLEATH